MGMNRVIPATSALFSLCLAVACSPESIGGGNFGDSAAPDILPDDASTGDPEDPADASTGEGGGGSTGDTTGDEPAVDEFPACLDRDPALTGDLSFDFGAWGSPETADSMHINADCFSSDFHWDFDGHAAYIELRCSQGDLLDEPISALIDLGPYPFLEVPVGAKFHIEAGWVNNPTKAASYQYFILEDEVSHDVQLAALLNVVDGANIMLGNLHLDVAHELCPWVCDADCADGGTPVERAALVVSVEQTDLSVEILDGRRDSLEVFGTTYEILAGRLMQRRMSNYSELDSAIVIASTPIY